MQKKFTRLFLSKTNFIIFFLFKNGFKFLFENEKIKKTINNFFKDLKKIYK